MVGALAGTAGAGDCAGTSPTERVVCVLHGVRATFATGAKQCQSPRDSSRPHGRAQQGKQLRLNYRALFDREPVAENGRGRILTQEWRVLRICCIYRYRSVRLCAKTHTRVNAKYANGDALTSLPMSWIYLRGMKENRRRPAKSRRWALAPIAIVITTSRRPLPTTSGLETRVTNAHSCGRSQG